jgi:hypothetical protein
VNDSEVVALCRYIAALTPAQQWDEFTADAWADILPGDLTLDDARAAVIVIKQRQQWVDPSDIIAEVRQARRPAIEAAWLATLLDRDSYAAMIEAENDAFLRKLDARRSSARRLKAVPPPDYSQEPA